MVRKVPRKSGEEKWWGKVVRKSGEEKWWGKVVRKSVEKNYWGKVLRKSAEEKCLAKLFGKSGTIFFSFWILNKCIWIDFRKSFYWYQLSKQIKKLCEHGIEVLFLFGVEKIDFSVSNVWSNDTCPIIRQKKREMSKMPLKLNKREINRKRDWPTLWDLLL